MEPIRLLRGQPVAARILDDVTRRAHALVAARGDARPRARLDRRRSRLQDLPRQEEEPGRALRHRRRRPGAFPPRRRTARVFDALAKLATEPRVHGVLVQMPLPPGWPAQDAPARRPAGQGRRRLPSREPGAPRAGPARLRRLHAAGHPAAAARLRDPARRPPRHRRRPQLDRRHADVAAASRKGVDATVTVAHSRTPDLAAVAARPTCSSWRWACRWRSAASTSSRARSSSTSASTASPRRPPTDPAGTRLVGDVRAEELAGHAAALSPVPGRGGAADRRLPAVEHARCRRARGRGPRGDGLSLFDDPPRASRDDRRRASPEPTAGRPCSASRRSSPR